MLNIQSYPTLETPWTVACQAPLVHGISHARLLDWVAIYLSKGSSRPGTESTSPACRQSLVLQANSLPTEPWGKPLSGVRRLICGVCPRNQLWGHFSEESLYFIWNWSISWCTVRVTQLCPILCNLMDCSMPVSAVYHQLPKLAQSHAIQPSHSLSSTFPPAFNLSQPEGLLHF